MSKSRKIAFLITFVLGFVLIISGVSYAALTYISTGSNEELIVGDIWMKYDETNQLILEDAMPINIKNYITYEVNQIMATQEIEDNELSKCVVYFRDIYGWGLAEGENFIDYCKGTGTEYGYTIQEDWDNWMSESTEYSEYLIENNIFIKDGENYVVNSIMLTQEMEDNELNRCMDILSSFLYSEEYFDKTYENFCKGTDTFEGEPIQKLIENLIEEYGSDFLNVIGQELLNSGVINQNIDRPYFEFTIEGKNTYTKKDIYYDIVLSHGDSYDERTTRIKDDLLRFTLIEMNGEAGTILFNNRSFSDLTNQRVWVDTISKNTTEKIKKKYRLYMWISDDTIIGNNNQDYTLEEWSDVYASIKVNVSGDFLEKNLPLYLGDEFREVLLTKQYSYFDEDGVYYVTGNKNDIDFNYVWYSGKLWRITEVHPDGSLKMITENNITAISYGPDYNFYKDETESSWIYQWLNEDFLDTLYNYENIIEIDYKWNVTAGNGNNSTKLEKKTMVTSKVGLLNSYEHYLNCGRMSNCYLNNGYHWWLSNPYDPANSSSNYSKNVWIVNPDYYNSGIGHNPVDMIGVRPVVVLKSSVKLAGGTGTRLDPYRIKGDKDDAVLNTTLLNTRSSGEYVNFNGETYRIVEIENDLIKINKVDYLKNDNNIIYKNYSTQIFGEVKSPDTNKEGLWEYYLNNIWYNSILENYRNMMIEGTYYLGKISSFYDGDEYIYNRSYKNTICETVSNVVSTKDCQKVSSTYHGYVGLPRIGEMFSSQLGNGNSSSVDLWLITPDANNTSQVWYVDKYGRTFYYPLYMTSAARPSIYLKSSVKITGGSGTENSPFEISIS